MLGANRLAEASVAPRLVPTPCGARCGCERANRHYVQSPDFRREVNKVSRVADEESRARAPGYRTARMDGFSDGVFSIAVTLLVFEIGVPSGSGTIC